MKTRVATTFRIALLLAAATMVAFGVLVGPDLDVHYYCWRLDRCDARREASVWTDKLEKEFNDRESSEIIVRNLGQQRPRLTFWVFDHIHRASLEEEGPSSLVEELFPAQLGSILPLVLALEERLVADERLLSVWAQYLRWVEEDRWRYVNELAAPKRREGLVEKLIGGILSVVIGSSLDFTDDILQCARRNPQAFEASVRLTNLELLAEAWILGMHPLPRVPSFSLPRSVEEVKALETGPFGRMPDEIESWLATRRGSLTFDPALGRFVPRTVGDATVALSKPGNPVPRWNGPEREWNEGRRGRGTAADR